MAKVFPVSVDKNIMSHRHFDLKETRFQVAMMNFHFIIQSFLLIHSHIFASNHNITLTKSPLELYVDFINCGYLD